MPASLLEQLAVELLDPRVAIHRVAPGDWEARTFAGTTGRDDTLCGAIEQLILALQFPRVGEHAAERRLLRPAARPLVDRRPKPQRVEPPEPPWLEIALDHPPSD